MKAYAQMKSRVEKLVEELEQDVMEIMYDELSGDHHEEYDYHLGRKEAKENVVEKLKKILEEC